MFPNSFVEHLKYSVSDHVPILFHTQRPAPIFGGDRGRPWRFKARCIRREECEGIIRDSWKERGGGTTFERLFNGVEGCHMGLGLLTRGSGTSPHKRNYEKNLLFLDKELLTSKGRRRWGGVDGNWSIFIWMRKFIGDNGARINGLRRAIATPDFFMPKPRSEGAIIKFPGYRISLGSGKIRWRTLSRLSRSISGLSFRFLTHRRS